jgi:tRNA threonylcarbamoyladenosine biosynthesis protein TsaE
LNTLVSHSLQDLNEVAEKLVDLAKDVRIIAFSGNLGAGKTTLIREILKTFAIEDFAGSPTFSLVNEYENENGSSIYHFDFYRIKEEDEALDIGWDEYLSKENAWLFLEWPEKIENLLPDHFLWVKIKHSSAQRTFEWKMF